MKAKNTLTGDALMDFKRKKNYKARLMRAMYGAFLCGYQNKTLTLTERQCMFRASKDNMDVVSGVRGRLRYDFHAIMLSRGKMEVPQNATIEYKSTEEALIRFIAPTPKDGNWCRYICVVQYNACKRVAVISKAIIEEQNVGLFLKPGEGTYGDEIRYWIYFESEDRSSRSDSVHLGQIKPLSN
ncbi:hypothetical protein [Pedobacter sp. MR2016-24]|uniref:hypothetical protein n=1 Tax=Pedobacter sp. MR2016-24 TaxID=2994466 RepID=UPI002247D36F|nr:hypothetical protein [Pedobacter sp. MR2016-24]MCX2483744.1 hypothetical protein [Pedobacter sp. MR2016-24]